VNVTEPVAVVCLACTLGRGERLAGLDRMTVAAGIVAVDGSIVVAAGSVRTLRLTEMGSRSA
jgi:hypothetical protein